MIEEFDNISVLEEKYMQNLFLEILSGTNLL
jgi:hypothetical protein